MASEVSTGNFAGMLWNLKKLWSYEEMNGVVSPVKLGVVVAGTALLGYKASTFLREYRGEKWKFAEMRKRRQRERLANLSSMEAKVKLPNGNTMDSARLAILRLPTDVLLLKLSEKTLAPMDVLRAFQARALAANQSCNCVALFIEEADAWCTELTENDENRKKMPLYGLPVSIKEDFDVAGLDTTLGFSKFLYEIKEKDAVIVQTLKRLGAIPFCKTNVPQSLMSSCSCSNPIYGMTTNPFNKNVSPGGSSGGEGALISFGGSPLGIGSDIGGSVRIPAVFCGIAALKPTGRRISCIGEKISLPGCQGMVNTPGIMARNVDTLSIAVKEIFSSGFIHEQDATSVPLLWRENMVTVTRPLRIGYYETSNVYPSTPGARRAVRESVEALKSDGHCVVQFPCCDSMQVMEDIMKLYLADGGSLLGERWTNDTVDSTLSKAYSLTRIPNWLRRAVLQPLLRIFNKYTWITGATSADELWRLMVIRDKRSHEYIKQWKELNLDLVIGPGFAFPAVKPNMPGDTAALYTCLYNYLDYPVGVVPVTRENEEDQRLLTDSSSEKKPDSSRLHPLVIEAVAGATGLPLGVQVIGLPWQEETVVRGLLALDRALEKRYGMKPKTYMNGL